MKTLEAVYSPLCEANGAFLGKLREWLEDTEVCINAIPFNELPAEMAQYYSSIREDCFIDIFYNGRRIDSVPLHKAKIYEALNIHREVKEEKEDTKDRKKGEIIGVQAFKELVCSGEIEWIPITKESFLEEMSMCLCNYPYGNPPVKYHKDCMDIKRRVFDTAFEIEDIAGIYAKYRDNVIGLLEVFPREILRAYGYLTGETGDDGDYLAVGCYEIAYGIPRKEMIDELMYHLEGLYGSFKRNYLEAVGVYGWNEGFRPYWVYEKYGFARSGQISENMAVLRKAIH